MHSTATKQRLHHLRSYLTGLDKLYFEDNYRSHQPIEISFRILDHPCPNPPQPPLPSYTREVPGEANQLTRPCTGSRGTLCSSHQQCVCVCVCPAVTSTTGSVFLSVPLSGRHVAGKLATFTLHFPRVHSVEDPSGVRTLLPPLSCLHSATLDLLRAATQHSCDVFTL